MKIGVAGSMHKTEDLLKYRDELIGMGHDPFVTSLASPFLGKTDEEKESIKLYQKNNLNAIREFWSLMQGADALLVVNVEKDGVADYIGEIHSSKWALLTC